MNAQIGSWIVFVRAATVACPVLLGFVAPAFARQQVVGWGGTPSQWSPAIPSVLAYSQVAAGQNHSVALRADGTVAVWGSSNFGQNIVPSGLGGVTQVCAGANFTLALRNNGTAVG